MGGRQDASVNREQLIDAELFGAQFRLLEGIDRRAVERAQVVAQGFALLREAAAKEREKLGSCWRRAFLAVEKDGGGIDFRGRGERRGGNIHDEMDIADQLSKDREIAVGASARGGEKALGGRIPQGTGGFTRRVLFDMPAARVRGIAVYACGGDAGR